MCFSRHVKGSSGGSRTCRLVVVAVVVIVKSSSSSGTAHEYTLTLSGSELK